MARSSAGRSDRGRTGAQLRCHADDCGDRGAPVPEDRPIDGENVSALLRGEAFRRARPLYWEFDDPNGFSFALRDGRWKLLADRVLTRVRLFDLTSDRFEVVDRAVDSPRSSPVCSMNYGAGEQKSRRTLRGRHRERFSGVFARCL